MRKIATIGFILVFCLLIAACSTNNDIAPVEHEPPADVSQVAPIMPQSPSPPPQDIIPVALPEPVEDGEQPFCYSNYIGIWRGYAIAVFETLVITDVIEDEMKFLFVRVFDAAGFPDTASSVYTMPILDNQITLAEEGTDHLGEQFTSYRILTFYDDHIVLLRRSVYSEERIFENEWRLTRFS